MTLAPIATRPARSLGWERLDAAQITSDLRLALSGCVTTPLNWKAAVHRPAKDKLKTFLFAAQSSKCAYCRRDIKDEDGHVEIDHILPKESKGKYPNTISNNDKERRSTSGYPEFTFEPLNLVLTCKRYNNRKGTYDSRQDRSHPAPNSYPLNPSDFVWVHPYLHEYSQNITIYMDFIFIATGGSACGLAVIVACKLDEISVVEHKSRDAIAKKSKNWMHFLFSMARDIDYWSDEAIIAAVNLRFPDADESSVRQAILGIRNVDMSIF